MAVRNTELTHISCTFSKSNKKILNSPAPSYNIYWFYYKLFKKVAEK